MIVSKSELRETLALLMRRSDKVLHEYNAGDSNHTRDDVEKAQNTHDVFMRAMIKYCNN
jgi:hypothetical protein